MKKYTLLLLGFIILLCPHGKISAEPFQPLKVENGMVVTADPLASQIGLDILRNGGNAIDASVAVAFAMAVTYPTAGNIGGGGFMVYRHANDKVYALDYREKAPLAASRDMYIDSSGTVIRNASLLGYRACGVPGTVDGFWQAHKKFGKMNWADLISPAIELAEKGFVIDEYKQDALKDALDDLNRFPAARAIFTRNGMPIHKGELLIQKDLAKTLRLISRKGADGFYHGVTARKIEDDMKRNGGLITTDDLEAYSAVWRDPVTIKYRGHELYSMPPPSSGGIILAEILNCLEQYNLQQFGHNSADLMHLWTEIERLAYADRALLLGDSDFIEVPAKRLTSKQYAGQLIKKLSFFKAGNSKSIAAANGMMQESDQTTHFSIVDQWGNAVSNTYTLNGTFGSRVVINGTGILMNNEMDDFSIKPGHPNMFGLVGTKANAIEPGKRMLSSMTPTIITRNDSLIMVIGSPGGSKIITTVAQVISNVIDHGMNIRQGIEAPRFHHQWLPDVIYLEKNRFSCDTVNKLVNRGYTIEELDLIGYAQGILIIENGSVYSGWSDPRSNGMVRGY